MPQPRRDHAWGKGIRHRFERRERQPTFSCTACGWTSDLRLDRARRTWTAASRPDQASTSRRGRAVREQPRSRARVGKRRGRRSCAASDPGESSAHSAQWCSINQVTEDLKAGGHTDSASGVKGLTWMYNDSEQWCITEAPDGPVCAQVPRGHGRNARSGGCDGDKGRSLTPTRTHLG